MKYSIGDIITDQRGNSVEITEIQGSCYVGRKIGVLPPWAGWYADSCQVDVMDLDVLTLAERIEGARQRQSEAGPSEHVAALLARLESI